MRFGSVPVAQAKGAILAHSLRLPGGALKKGSALTEENIALLRAAGVAEVVAARPDPTDIPEDEAAGRISRALIAQGEDLGLRLAAPFTGRANIYAERAGVLRINAGIVHALNAVDEAITLATVSDLCRVAERQLVGTVKIIPYAVSLDAVERAEALLRQSTTMQIDGLTVRSARLILTRTPAIKDSVLAKGAKAITNRLASLGILSVVTDTVPHEDAALASALTRGDEDLLLVLTASATSDRHDVGPAALLRAGGTLTRFGMPVDPGNLLFLGALGGRPVIGLPGCARSPKLNGADWVLERIACGLDVTDQDIAAMGVGGLLKEIPSRPSPRSGGAAAPRRPIVAAIVLAAGAARRMGGEDKLVKSVGTSSLLRHVVDGLTQSSVDRIFCVTRPDDTERRGVLDGLDVQFVDNPRAAEGMGTSIAAGASVLEDDVDAALIVLGDMPDLTATHFDALLAGFDPGEGRAIVRATTQDGTPGHPVLIGRRFFEALRGLNGDQGARTILSEHKEFVVDVPLDGRVALTDLDTPDDWSRWQASDEV